MEDLLAYSKYERVLCIAFDKDEQLSIQACSNRVMKTEKMRNSQDYTLHNKSVQSLLKEYLDACAKGQDQQSEEEKHAILKVQQYSRHIRQKLLEDENIMFDRCQILFALPLGWNCNKYMDQLRALFMETEWITQDDPKNRLIFSPFIEGLCQYLTAVNRYNFEREKKYLLLSMDKTAIHLLSFQIQGAKELIAVFKKLAVSDFLLLPTDLGDAVTMAISDLDYLIYNKVKKIIIRQVSNGMQRKRFYKKGGFKLKKDSKKITRKQHNNMEAAAQPLFSVTNLRRIINEIIDILYGIMSEDKEKQLHQTLHYLEGSKEILRGLTCGVLMNDLLTDTNVKSFVNQVVCKVQGIFSKYSNVENSPDGIQDVILHYRYSANKFWRELLRMALLVVDAQNEFICADFEDFVCVGAMQKPFKMIQIANALLPPTIWKDGNSKQLEWTDYNTREEDLLPPNSFYVQAYINDDHIRFILNKVIAVSSLNGTVQKSTFTIQEMSVELESILDSVCDTMWNHLMMPECQRNSGLLDHCDTHLAGEYSAANYYFFKCSIQEMTEKLLKEDFVTCNQDIDSNHAIHISKECNCSFQLSFRTLIDIALQPAISHIATVIASSLSSNSFFGLYTVSTLIIMDDSREGLLQKHHNTFKKTLQRCLQAYHGKTVVFYSKEAVMACGSLGSWCAGLQQVFGKGSYSQVSSTDYILHLLGTRVNGYKKVSEMDKYHSNSPKKGGFIRRRPNEFVLLEKGQAIDPNGTVHAFHPGNPIIGTTIRLSLSIRNRHANKESHYYLWCPQFWEIANGYSLTVRVTPQHHLSTIEFQVSCIKKKYRFIYPDSKSFSIQERLALK